MSEQHKQAGLFGQKFSSRDYHCEDAWGKNQFNSSFPASLVAYMGVQGIKPVLVCTDANNAVIHKHITASELYGLDPCGDDTYYDYEANFYPYEKFYTAAKKEKIDLVLRNGTSGSATRGLEVKLTTLPDSTTAKAPEDEWGTEMVVRSPTILFLACSICEAYETPNGRTRLHDILNTIGVEIRNWGLIRDVAPHYEAIEQAVLSVSKDMIQRQTPLIMQPVWKTNRALTDLAEDCLDVFVWTNLAIVQMCLREKAVKPDDISRNQRTIIWLYKMLWDFTLYGRFNYTNIVNELAYNYKTDKAFAISGKLTNPMLRCPELTHPRVKKGEIRNIILGDGWKFLRPERRFDAFLVSHPELFNEP